jgi:hypothetical protein
LEDDAKKEGKAHTNYKKKPNSISLNFQIKLSIFASDFKRKLIYDDNNEKHFIYNGKMEKKREIT